MYVPSCVIPLLKSIEGSNFIYIYIYIFIYDDDDDEDDVVLVGSLKEEKKLKRIPLLTHSFWRLLKVIRRPIRAGFVCLFAFFFSFKLAQSPPLGFIILGVSQNMNVPLTLKPQSKKVYASKPQFIDFYFFE
jgi:hypothetical protein